MFDIADFSAGIGQAAEVDPRRLAAILSRLSPTELDDLEDDLDFCVFSGVPSVRILAIMDMLGVLDRDWRELLNRRTAA